MHGLVRNPHSLCEDGLKFGVSYADIEFTLKEKPNGPDARWRRLNPKPMNNCWVTLNIERTNDLEVIKRARRSLIKRWHPDTVTSAEEQPNHTIRCMEINAAFDKALRIANHSKGIAPNRIRKDNENDQNWNFPNAKFRSSALDTFDGYQCAILVVVLVLLSTIRTFLFLFLSLAFFAAVLAGALSIGLVDLLLFKLVVHPVLSTISLLWTATERQKRKLAWSLLLLFNIFIMHLGIPGVGTSAFGTLLGGIFSASVACAVPAWLWRRWFKESPTMDCGEERHAA